MPSWIHARSGHTTTKGRDNDEEISNQMTALTAAAATSCVLGGGVATVLLPVGIAVPGPSQGADDTVGHVRHARGVDEPVSASPSARKSASHPRRSVKYRQKRAGPSAHR